MFFWVVPVALAGFVIAWFLPEVPLRHSARAGAGDVGEGMARASSPTRTATSRALLDQALTNIATKLLEEKAREQRTVAA
ncbi:hypothetical protein [Nocardia arthritidis]|uniref:hypothetical protein n=1 Tax=Nocardia arthritidis TaxID=228602 RepID=UPI0007A4BDFD|nr:hypothetical protein [Nocardia arthritidis]